MSLPPIVILHVLPDLAMGGGQQVVLRTIRHTDRAAFQHHVCYFYPNHDLAPRFREAGVEARYIEYKPGISALYSIRRVFEILREHRVDLVHVQGTPVDKICGQVAALLCGVPVVRTLHGPRFRPGAIRAIVRNGILELFDYVLEPVTVRHYVAVSDAVEESWRPYLRHRGMAGRRVSVIPNGVPIGPELNGQDASRRAALRGSLALQDADPVLINVGRLDRRKGVRMLVPTLREVLRRHPSAVLLQAGDGPLRDEIAHGARNAGLDRHLRLLGPREDVAELLAISDLLVFPSLGEGMPLVVLEAMAAGVPVAAFALPGLSDIINEQTGRLVQERSSSAFGGAVLELLGDREALRQRGRAARALVSEGYDIGRNARRIEAVYRSVLRRDERSAWSGRPAGLYT
jgi:glycosyltransferase involved in cell wall biosynthesis